jgi:hypothetical protein
VVRPAAVRLLVVGAVIAVAAATVVVAPWSAPSAEAQCGPTVSVSKTDGLDPAGEVITVSGTCFDPNKGIYVAFCVVPPPGQPPSPCGGGVAMEGSGGLSHWISSNPPPYAQGLTIPWGPGGSFSVTLRPSAALNPDIDCRVVACAVATRADHTRGSDRSLDAVIPLTFSEPVVAPPPTEPPPTEPPPTEPPTTVPETTVAPTTTTSTTTAPTTTEPAEPVDAELAAAPDEGGSSSGPIVVVVVAVAVLAALAVGGGLWRRRNQSVDTP